MEPIIAEILTTLQQTAKVVDEIGRISSRHETKLVDHEVALARHETAIAEHERWHAAMRKVLADSVADSAKKWAEHEAWQARFEKEMEEWKALGRQNDERIAALVDMVDELNRRRPPAA